MSTPKTEHQKEIARERHRRWRERNRQELRERAEQFRRDNPDYLPGYYAEHREHWHDYEKNDRERVNARRRERYAEKKRRPS